MGLGRGPVVRYVTAVLTLAAVVPMTAYGVALTVSPASIRNDSTGQITVTITGLSSGLTVRVDRIMDLNGNGVIDVGEPIGKSFTVTDGQLPTIGGVRNINVPGDEDGAVNGQIIAKVSYPAVDVAFDHIAGTYIYRVSALDGSFQPVTKPLTVTQNTSLPQGVNGTITGNGHPLANVPVIVHEFNGNGGVGAFTDASGHYMVYSQPGSYVVVAVANGFVGANTATSVEVGAGQFVNENIAATPASFAVSGTLTDTTTTAPLAGISIIGQTDSGLLAVGFTDASGHYALSVTSGEWFIAPSQEAASDQGYVSPNTDHATIDIQVNGDVANADIALPKATALFYGTVTDQQANPVTVTLEASEQDGPYRPEGRSFGPGGMYAIGVIGGPWNVGPNQDEASSLGLLTTQTMLTISDGQAIRQDFTVLTATAHITGTVHDSNGNPIANLNVYADATIDGTQYNLNTNTDQNGNYSLGVTNGQWQVGVDCNDLSSRGLPCPGNEPVAISGQNQTVNFCVGCGPHLRGTVFDDSGAPVAAIHVVAGFDDNPNSQALTDSGGHFDIGLSANNGTWTLQLSANEAAQRGLVSPMLTENVNGNDINNILFVAKRSTANISGTVMDSNGSGVGNVGVVANATINGVSYTTGVRTNSGGNFGLPVINGQWLVGVSCNDLSSDGFTCPLTEFITVNNDNPMVNFVVQGMLRVTTTSLPAATQGVAYATQLQASGGQPPYTWSLGADTPFLPPVLNLDASGGSISGTPAVVGSFSVHAIVTDATSQQADAMLMLVINAKPSVCVGNCYGSGTVTVDEILTLVNIALGIAQPSACPEGIPSGANVDIALILTAVNNALTGCTG